MADAEELRSLFEDTVASVLSERTKETLKRLHDRGVSHAAIKKFIAGTIALSGKRALSFETAIDAYLARLAEGTAAEPGTIQPTYQIGPDRVE